MSKTFYVIGEADDMALDELVELLTRHYQDDTLRLVSDPERVRNNAPVDWTIKESAGVKLRVIVKHTLRKYGYPPCMEKLATDTVLKQAELIADELTKWQEEEMVKEESLNNQSRKGKIINYFSESLKSFSRSLIRRYRYTAAYITNMPIGITLLIDLTNMLITNQIAARIAIKVTILSL
jgi:hypothetical protein